MYEIRESIEHIIKDCGINRERATEVPKNIYQSIIKNIESKFVLHGGNIHRSNMGGRFQPQLPCKTINIGENRLWYRSLKRMVPNLVDYGMS